MSSFRIRRDAREFLVEDDAALLRLARTGALTAEDEVRDEPDGLWTTASVHPLLWEIFQADPWSAWDDLDAVEDPEKVWRELAKPVSAESSPPQVSARPEETGLDPDEDQPTFRPRRPRRGGSVTPGKRWAGPAPTSSDDINRLAGVRAQRPEGIKLPAPSEDRDEDSGRVQVQLPPTAAVKVTVPATPAADEPSTDLPPVVSLDDAAAPPEPSDLSEVSPPAVDKRGQVIAFPSRSPRPTAGGGRGGAAQPATKRAEDSLLPPVANPLPTRPSLPVDELSVRGFSSPPPKKSDAGTATINLWKAAPVVLIAGAVLAIGAWWTSYVSNQNFKNIPVVEAPKPRGGAAEAAVEEPGEPLAPDPVAEAADGVEDESDAMISALRAKLPVGSQPVANEEDLEEALLMELSRMGIYGAQIQATAVGLAGDDERSVLDEVELLIHAPSKGEYDRELAGIGLVVGKYVKHYDLNVLGFQVILNAGNGKGIDRRLDGDKAASFYSKRITLEEFIFEG
jgi:hypothetical protein